MLDDPEIKFTVILCISAKFFGGKSEFSPISVNSNLEKGEFFSQNRKRLVNSDQPKFISFFEIGIHWNRGKFWLSAKKFGGNTEYYCKFYFRIIQHLYFKKSGIYGGHFLSVIFI